MTDTESIQTHVYYRLDLPSSCTAFSQAFTVNSFTQFSLGPRDQKRIDRGEI